MTFPMVSPSAPEPAAVSGPAIVVGYDRRPSSRAALMFAVDLAVRLRAGHLHVVHAVDLLDYPVDPDRADWDQQGGATLAAERAYVEETLASSTVAWTYHVGRAGPVRLLAEVAEAVDAYLIVVGTQGGGIGSMLSRLGGGSVSRGLMHSAHRPVVVVGDSPEPAEPDPVR